MTLLRLLLLMVITIGGVGQKSLFATDAFPSTLREPIRQTNALLKARLVGEKVTFADIGLCLAGEDGLALPQYFRDTVHPNAAGYARLAAALKPYLSRLGGE